MTPRDFIMEPQASRVIFGDGTLARVDDELARLGVHRAVLLSTPEQAAQARDAVSSRRIVDRLDKAVMHTPLSVTEAALAQLRQTAADGIVSFGGGSTTGLGKALALRSGLPHLTIPTTYAGSEMTPILGETDAGVKTTRRDPAILPKTVIYDVSLTLGLPVAMSVTSGLNAMAHAVEALYAADRNPVVEHLAEQALSAFAAALPVLVTDPANAAARRRALYGAWACGTCLGQVAMGLHHKLAHVLGGSFDLPHAPTHAVLLPHVTSFNAAAAPVELAAVSRALEVSGDPGAALYDFAAALGAPLRLADFGFTDADADRAAEIAVRVPYANPRPFDAADILRLLKAAVRGDRPQGASNG
jgi:maleylacetate reductase